MSPTQFETMIFGSAVVAVAAAVGRILIKSRRFQFFGGLVHRAPVTAPVVALTFDDGPYPEYCAALLDTLKRHAVRATFFVIGSAAERAPNLMQRIVADGHELANHSYSHRRMLLKSAATIRDEVECTDALIRAAGQRRPVHFRPPFGAKLLGLPRYLSRTKRRTIMWDVAPDSTRGRKLNAMRIVSTTVNQTRAGSIILLHAMARENEETRAALPEIITRLRARGFQFVTVSELLHLCLAEVQ